MINEKETEPLMLVISYLECNYCGHKFEDWNEDELSIHLLSKHAETKTLDVHIVFEQSQLENLIRGIQ